MAATTSLDTRVRISAGRRRVVLAARALTIVAGVFGVSVGSSGHDALPSDSESSQPAAMQLSSDDKSGVPNAELVEESQNGCVAISDDDVTMYTLGELAQHFADPIAVSKRARIKYHASDLKMRGGFVGMFGINSVDSPFYPSVVRVYRMNGDVTVALEELDFEAAGVTMTHVAEMINTDINGIPATVTLRCAPSGRGLVLVSWITSSRFLKLALTGANIGPAHRTMAVELARSIRE